MTADVYCNRLVPRSASSHAAHTTSSPRHTCSAVTSGFFPPQPARLAGHEGQRYTTQHQVTHQGHIILALEMAEADLPLAQPETVLHVPTCEGHTQQPPQRRPL